MCAAETRWVQYDVTLGGTISDGRGAGCKGTSGTATALSNIGDTINIGPTTNRLYLQLDGSSGPYITLTSGIDLDPRMIAQDITNKLRSLGKNDDTWDKSLCLWENNKSIGNSFKIYSGSLGLSSSVAISTSGDHNAYQVLGFDTRDEVGGAASNNNYQGYLDVSGVYKGFLPEIYTIVITNDNSGYSRGIGDPVSNINYDGVLTTGGIYNGSADTTYTLSIDTTNGTTMGAGTGNVPKMSWSSSPVSDSSTSATELLYPDYWYNVGTLGLMVKFSDAVFDTGSWTIDCYKPDYAEGTNLDALPGQAYFAYSSTRGDMAGAALTSASGVSMSLGSRGVNITFKSNGSSDKLRAGDTFKVTCHGPLPQYYDIDSINFGNVTVSTESDVKCVGFEVLSGACILSSVRFGLHSHGSFLHHDAGNMDTLMHFGTAGPGQPAGSGNEDGIEFYPNIQPTDIDSDIPPAYLHATKANLSEVTNADDSELVGNTSLISDPIWFGIKLGASETGASQVIYRLFFDYS